MPRTPAALPPAMKNRGIAALIWELPDPELLSKDGTDWPHEAREAWFEYARKTVEVVYGPLRLRKQEAPPRGYPAGTVITGDLMSSSPPSAAPRYQIEPDGTASVRVGKNNRPIDPENIPPDTVVHDYRNQPVDNEYNPIMWKTQGHVKLDLPPGVIVRAATEPWTTPSAANGSAEVSP